MGGRQKDYIISELMDVVLPWLGLAQLGLALTIFGTNKDYASYVSVLFT